MDELYGRRNYGGSVAGIFCNHLSPGWNPAGEAKRLLSTYWASSSLPRPHSSPSPCHIPPLGKRQAWDRPGPMPDEHLPPPAALAHACAVHAAQRSTARGSCWKSTIERAQAPVRMCERGSTRRCSVGVAPAAKTNLLLSLPLPPEKKRWKYCQYHTGGLLTACPSFSRLDCCLQQTWAAADCPRSTASYRI